MRRSVSSSMNSWRAAIAAVVLSHLALLAAQAQLPDLYTSPLLDIVCSPSVVVTGETLTVGWKGANNQVIGIPGDPQAEVFGPAYGPWTDGIFLRGAATISLSERLCLMASCNPGHGTHVI